MGHTAEEIDRCLLICAFEFTAGRTYSTQGFKPAVGTFGAALGFFLPDRSQMFPPPFPEITYTQIVAVGGG